MSEQIKGSLQANILHWELCADAEPRLRRSIKEKAVLLVDDVFLVKFYGRLSSLALKDAVLSDGSKIQKGYWYSPARTRFRDEIYTAFDNRETRLTSKDPVWVPIRKVHLGWFNTWFARRAAEKLPAKGPELLCKRRRKYTRKRYRTRHWEWDVT